MSSNRRNFLKALSLLPLAATAKSETVVSETPAIASEFGPKLKSSLNVYSFNSLLRDNKIDLFDVLDFCAEQNFDAVDPTGYYFPGYPDVQVMSSSIVSNERRFYWVWTSAVPVCGTTLPIPMLPVEKPMWR